MPGMDDGRPMPQRTDSLYPWDSHYAAIKTDRTGTISRIEQVYRP
jgi:hypothetical protein